MTILTDLNNLESAGLIRLARLQPELEYLFQHALVQEAAYASLLESDRQRLHRSVGEAVEDLYGDCLDERAAMLAYHFERAGDAARARRYFLKAGKINLKAYANQEAETLFRRALSLAQQADADRALALAGLGAALHSLGRFDEALAVWQESVALYRQMDCWDDVGSLYARMARTAWFAGDTPGGLRWARLAMEVMAAAPEGRGLARVLHETARACFFNGLPQEARHFGERALAMAGRLQLVDVEADTLVTLSMLPNQTTEAVIAQLDRAIALAEDIRLLSVASRAYHNRGIVRTGLLGDLHGAFQDFVRATEIAHLRGSVREELLALVNQGFCRLRLGDIPAAREIQRRVVQLSSQLVASDQPERELLTIGLLLAWYEGRTDEALAAARAWYAQGQERGDLQARVHAALTVAEFQIDLAQAGEPADLDEAEAILNAVLPDSQRGFSVQVEALCALAHIHARRGQVAEARRLLACAQAVEELPAPVWRQLGFLLVEKEVAEAEGDWDRALACAEEIANAYARRGWRWAQTFATEVWATLHERRGAAADLKRAQTLLREALVAFEEMGAHPRAAHLENRLQAVRARLADQALAYAQSAQELAAARRIQESILPVAPPRLPGWDIAASLQPARQTSGDFYDFIPLPAGAWGFLLADVADKGAGAAMYMAISRTTLRNAANLAGAAPAETVRTANDSLLTDTRSDLFVTLFYGVMTPADGQFTYVNAGHNPPLLWRAGATQPLWLPRTGLALGVISDVAWEALTITLNPGDVLISYTDGVTETQNADGELFGEQRLAAVVAGCAHQPAGEIQSAILTALRAFAGAMPPFDDTTLLVIRRTTGVL